MEVNKSSRAERLIELAVTPAGFVPAEVTVKAGQPVRLVVTRKTERTCATRIVIKDWGIDETLPLRLGFYPKRKAPKIGLQGLGGICLHELPVTPKP